MLTLERDLPVNFAIFHKYAYPGKGPSNHSPGHMEVFKTQVDDKSIKAGEQTTQDRGRGTRLVTLKKRVPVVHFMVTMVLTSPPA